MSTAEEGTTRVTDHCPVFATTHRPVVLSAKDQDSLRSVEALEALCRTYWYPLYAYVRRRGYSPADAEDFSHSQTLTLSAGNSINTRSFGKLNT